MYAIIPAAGEGTRLRPYTKDRPKCMVEVGGKPILEHQILQLKKAGLTNLMLPQDYKSGVIRDYFGNGQNWGITIHHMDGLGYEIGSTGSIKRALERIPESEENVVVIYNDILSDLDIGELLRRHRENGLPITLALTHHTVPLGVVDVNAEGIVTSFREKPRLFVNTAICALQREIHEELPEGGDFFSFVQERFIGRMYGFESASWWRHITDGNDLRIVEQEFEARRSEETETGRGKERF